MKMTSDIMQDLNNTEEEMALDVVSNIQDLEISPSLLMLLPDPDIKPSNSHQFVSLEIEELSHEDVTLQKHYKTFYPVFYPLGSLSKTTRNAPRKQNDKIPKQKTTNQINKRVQHCRSYDQLGSKGKVTKMDYTEIAKLISCHVCQTLPITSRSIYTCSQGHQVCDHCYERGQVECEVCKEPLDFHNETLESTLQNLKETHPELFIKERSCNVNDDLEVNEHFRSLQVLSHKPMICPHLDCQRVIAFSGFRSHFLYDHSDVPVISLFPFIPYRFLLSEMFLENSVPRVVSVLMVESTSENEVRGAVKCGNSLICCILCIALELCGVKSLAIWCSCLYKGEFPPFNYTLTAPKTRGFINYKGPVSSLHEDPEEILEDGRCLFMAPNIVKNLFSLNEADHFIQIELEIIK